VPKPGEIGFPLDLNPQVETKEISKFQKLGDTIGFILLLWLFWSITLLVGLLAGKPMTNSLTGIESIVGAPARWVLQVLV